jgi:hypothetical protein
LTTRRSIFASSGSGQTIGYLDGGRAYDLLDRPRCEYNEATGNLRDSSTGKVVGHVTLDGRFVRVPWLADEVLPVPAVDAAQTAATPSDQVEGAKSGPSDYFSDADIERALKMVRATLGQS